MMMNIHDDDDDEIKIKDLDKWEHKKMPWYVGKRKSG